MKHQSPLLDVNDLEEQAEYYDRNAQEIKLEVEGVRRFKRAALALRITARLVKRHGANQLIADLDHDGRLLQSSFGRYRTTTPAAR